jgi:ABC-2 type transport system permease protein
MQAGIFSKEYSSGTLMLSLTKGMSRGRVIAAKTITLFLTWTACYALCFGVCYGYTAYFWDVSAAKDVFLAALIYWLYGMSYLAMLVFFSTLVKSNTGVIGCIAAVYLVQTIILSLIPKVKEVIPTYLSGIGNLTHGKDVAFAVPLTVTLILSAAMIVSSVPIFNKKQI